MSNKAADRFTPGAKNSPPVETKKDSGSDYDGLSSRSKVAPIRALNDSSPQLDEMIEMANRTPDETIYANLNEIRSNNRMDKFLNIDDPRRFLDEAVYDIKLHDLYEIIAACLSSDKSYWCPILVRTGNVLKNQNAYDNADFRLQTELKPYLLQIWDMKGNMVFESQLEKLVQSWSLQDDNFLFIEQD